MRILAIESAGKVASLALAEGGRIHAEHFLQTKNQHSVVLLPMVDQILAQADWPAKSLDLIAVSAGPGSFTGLRIGMATAKGLAYGLDLPLVGVPTLDAMAAPYAFLGGPVIPLINARRQEAYGAVFYKGERISDYFAQGAKETAKWLAGKDLAPPFFLGDGALALEADLRDVFPQGQIAPADLVDNRAGQLALLAEKIFNKEGAHPLFSLAPFYVRDSQAKKTKERAEDRAKAPGEAGRA